MLEKQTRSWMRFIKRLIRAGFDLILPPRCMGCGSWGECWCPVCHATLSTPTGSSCEICGLPRLFRHCPACENGIAGLKVNAMFAYQPRLKHALIALKYQPEKTFAELVAGWVEERMQRLHWHPDVIVPVPLSQVRLKQRGYNQVELITSALARSITIPHEPFMLERVRDTRSQVGLDPAARYLNQEHAFKSKADHIRVGNVLLVDDLLTSGATMMHCAQALFNAGVEQVHGLAVARA